MSEKDAQITLLQKRIEKLNAERDHWLGRVEEMVRSNNDYRDRMLQAKALAEQRYGTILRLCDSIRDLSAELSRMKKDPGQ